MALLWFKSISSNVGELEDGWEMSRSARKAMETVFMRNYYTEYPTDKMGIIIDKFTKQKFVDNIYGGALLASFTRINSK